MNDFFKTALIGGIGYAIGSAAKSNGLTEIIDRQLLSTSLEEYIDKYAHAHDIYACNEDFANELRKIANKYE